MIFLEGDPILSERCEPFHFESEIEDNEELARGLSKLLAAEMAKARGLGLAAPQIGHALRVFAVADKSGPIVCFNPAIVHRMDGEERGQEGCLSYPGVYVYVRRARRILARFQDVTGAWREREFAGLQARVFQHELDHLDGRTLKDLVPAQALILARARAKKAA